MKRIMGIVLAVASLGFIGFTSEASAAEQSRSNVALTAYASPQWQTDRYGRRVFNRRRARTVTRSRVVRIGRRVYRETYLVRYRPNGTFDTRLLNRVRIA